MKDLCFLLPTNDPDTMKKYLLPSLFQLKYVADKICFAINFQDPYSEKDIQEILAVFGDLGIDVKYRFSKYTFARRGMITFNQIRYDCATLYPDVKYYALCDDDFVFEHNVDLMIDSIIQKLDTEQSLGVVQCDKKPPFIPFEYSIREPKYHCYFTSNGFFFRNVHDENGNITLFPQDALDKVGAGEEHIIGLELASRGYTTCVRTRSAINHIRDIDERGVSPYGWNEMEVLNHYMGVNTYLREKYKEILK